MVKEVLNKLLQTKQFWGETKITLLSIFAVSGSTEQCSHYNNIRFYKNYHQCSIRADVMYDLKTSSVTYFLGQHLQINTFPLRYINTQ